MKRVLARAATIGPGLALLLLLGCAATPGRPVPGGAAPASFRPAGDASEAAERPARSAHGAFDMRDRRVVIR